MVAKYGVSGGKVARKEEKEAKEAEFFFHAKRQRGIRVWLHAKRRRRQRGVSFFSRKEAKRQRGIRVLLHAKRRRRQRGRVFFPAKTQRGKEA
ncbi:hypothetical protein J2T02_001817 [Chitinophaga terrae (ex Kim and Jung 2007)]|uniref:hypothetical protein n=1 Tax=Chitinophaga terrae (ex Kim and Jung 2007) TaxID=408074 RepID=UPI00278BA716|nr:hypothetical protein [Chitinophaga terrae (ex Kim and Jung 2007)]MDQ0106706.1 hypothetical protein [Chitinophaga terrae (ex Kim and Jung 2007)]